MGVQQQATMISKHRPQRPVSEARRIRKPLMERKRRERINTSLNDLATLLTEAKMVKGAEGGRPNKLEKADILELTVRHIHSLKGEKGGEEEQQEEKMEEGNVVEGRYWEGFNRCVGMVEQALKKAGNEDLKERLMGHLKGCLGTSCETNSSEASSSQSSTSPVQQLLNDSIQQPAATTQTPNTSSSVQQPSSSTHTSTSVVSCTVNRLQSNPIPLQQRSSTPTPRPQSASSPQPSPTSTTTTISHQSSQTTTDSVKTKTNSHIKQEGRKVVDSASDINNVANTSNNMTDDCTKDISATEKTIFSVNSAHDTPSEENKTEVVPQKLTLTPTRLPSGAVAFIIQGDLDSLMLSPPPSSSASSSPSSSYSPSSSFSSPSSSPVISIHPNKVSKPVQPVLPTPSSTQSSPSSSPVVSPSCHSSLTPTHSAHTSTLHTSITDLSSSTSCFSTSSSGFSDIESPVPTCSQSTQYPSTSSTPTHYPHSPTLPPPPQCPPPPAYPHSPTPHTLYTPTPTKYSPTSTQYPISMHYHQPSTSPQPSFSPPQHPYSPPPYPSAPYSSHTPPTPPPSVSPHLHLLRMDVDEMENVDVESGYYEVDVESEGPFDLSLRRMWRPW